MKTAPLAFAVALVAFAHHARAQEPEAPQEHAFGAFIEGGSGVAIGGGDGYAVLQRARTFLVLGGTMRVPDMPNEQWSVGLLADIEPRLALGVEGTWGHWVNHTFLFEAGPAFYMLPETLLGVTAGMRVRIPVGKIFSLTPGVSFTGYFAGSDLPDNSAIVTATFVMGIHANL